MSPFLRVSICYSLLGLVSVSAAESEAEVNADSDASKEQIDIIHIEGTRAEPLFNRVTSASSGQVGRTDILPRPILRPGDVVEVVPGMVATQHSSNGKANQYFIRGFNLDHGTDFAFFVDGMPVNMRTHGHGHGYSDLNFLIPELIERVDYRFGPHDPATGDFSSAGWSHVRLIDALPDADVLASTTVGFHSYVRFLGAANWTLENDVKLLTAIETVSSDGPWVNEEDQQKINALARFSAGDHHQGWNVTFMAYDNSWDSTDQVPERAIETGIIDRLGAIDPTTGGESQRLSLSGSWHKEQEDHHWQAQAYFIQYDLDLWSNFTYFLEDTVDGDQFQQVDDRIIIGGSFIHSHDGQIGQLPFTQELGVDFRYDIIDEVGLYRSKDREKLSTIRKDSVDEYALGLWYESDLRWNEQWRTVFGLRADAFWADVDSDLSENSGDSDDQILSPSLSFIWTIDADNELSLNAGLGFHSNDARGTTIETDPVSLSPVDDVDFLVQTQGIDLGLRTTAIEGLHATLNLWYLELDSEILFVGDAGNTEAAGASQRFGIDFSGHFIPDAHPNINLDLDVSLVDAKFKDEPSDADKIPGSVPYVITTGCVAMLPRDWFTSIRLRHFGARPLEESGDIESDSSTLVNLAVGFERDSFKAKIEIFNLFDSDENDIEYYYASRLSGEPVSGVEDIHLHPSEPRSIRVTLESRF